MHRSLDVGPNFTATPEQRANARRASRLDRELVYRNWFRAHMLNEREAADRRREAPQIAAGVPLCDATAMTVVRTLRGCGRVAGHRGRHHWDR